MSASLNNGCEQNTAAVAKACAITFQGNASNKLQQDAFFFLDNWYQEGTGMMALTPVVAPFCFAVSDGVASSAYSQHCSKAVVKAVGTLWDSTQSHAQTITTDHIHDLISQTKHPCKRHGAAATLALIAGEMTEDGKIKATITHVGDSRIYHLPKGTTQWQCLTRDHNLLNEMIDEQAQQQGRQATLLDYNLEGMAGSLYGMTECFALSADDGYLRCEAPESTSCKIDVNSGDSIIVCTDGIHDLVPSRHWQPIKAETNLQDWLITLKDQVYGSYGSAYDNGTAILVRFD